MDKARALQLLKEQIEQIESLKKPPAYNPKYKIWNNTTKTILKEAFTPELVRIYEYVGPEQITISPEHVYKNYLVMLNEKKQLLEGFISEHERFAGTGNTAGRSAATCQTDT